MIALETGQASAFALRDILYGDSTETLTTTATEAHSRRTSQGASQEISQKVSKKVSQEISQKFSQEISQGPPRRGSQRSSQRASQRSAQPHCQRRLRSDDLISSLFSPTNIGSPNSGSLLNGSHLGDSPLGGSPLGGSPSRLGGSPSCLGGSPLGLVGSPPSPSSTGAVIGSSRPSHPFATLKPPRPRKKKDVTYVVVDEQGQLNPGYYVTIPNPEEPTATLQTFTFAEPLKALRRDSRPREVDADAREASVAMAGSRALALAAVVERTLDPTPSTCREAAGPVAPKEALKQPQAQPQAQPQPQAQAPAQPQPQTQAQEQAQSLTLFRNGTASFERALVSLRSQRSVLEVCSRRRLGAFHLDDWSLQRLSETLLLAVGILKASPGLLAAVISDAEGRCRLGRRDPRGRRSAGVIRRRRKRAASGHVAGVEGILRGALRWSEARCGDSPGRDNLDRDPLDRDNAGVSTRLGFRRRFRGQGGFRGLAACLCIRRQKLSPAFESGSHLLAQALVHEALMLLKHLVATTSFDSGDETLSATENQLRSRLKDILQTKASVNSLVEVFHQMSGTPESPLVHSWLQFLASVSANGSWSLEIWLQSLDPAVFARLLQNLAQAAGDTARCDEFPAANNKAENKASAPGKLILTPAGLGRLPPEHPAPVLATPNSTFLCQFMSDVANQQMCSSEMEFLASMQPRPQPRPRRKLADATPSESPSDSPSASSKESPRESMRVTPDETPHDSPGSSPKLWFRSEEARTAENPWKKAWVRFLTDPVTVDQMTRLAMADRSNSHPLKYLATVSSKLASPHRAAQNLSTKLPVVVNQQFVQILQKLCLEYGDNRDTSHLRVTGETQREALHFISTIQNALADLSQASSFTDETNVAPTMTSHTSVYGSVVVITLVLIILFAIVRGVVNLILSILL